MERLRALARDQIERLTNGNGTKSIVAAVMSAIVLSGVISGGISGSTNWIISQDVADLAARVDLALEDLREIRRKLDRKVDEGTRVEMLSRLNADIARLELRLDRIEERERQRLFTPSVP